MTRTKGINPADPISQAAEDGKNRKSFFSFGDEGVTATVGSNGRLLRISRHFPEERIGFCVDDPNMPEPYGVAYRLDTLLHWAEDPSNGGGIGPSIPGKSTETIVNDRWPTFDVELENGRKLKLQYVAFGGTIYQQFQFINYRPGKKTDDLLDIYSVPEISVKLDMLIRDLDFVNGYNSFNKDEFDANSYARTRHCGPCLIREHVNDHVNEKDDNTEKESIERADDGENDNRKGDNKKGVLSIHVLDEHGSFHFVKSDLTRSDKGVDVGPFIVQRKSATTWNALDDNSSGDSLTVTLAYTLEYVAENEPSIASAPSWKQVSQTMSELLQPVEKHSLTNNSNPTLDFFLRRNLEYILSVCSIPVSDTSKVELPSFALTCGDVDGHRVAGAASFNAFQFLLVALRHFRDLHRQLEPCDCQKDNNNAKLGSYVCAMKNRIDRVCGGHVKWILQRAYRPGFSFCPNLWVNGDEISGWKNNVYLPQKSLVDMPFQIIKACTYIDLVGMDNFPWPMPILSDIVKAWIGELDEINKLGLYAFPRYDNEPTQSFYLTDHALIWQAVKSAEALKLTPEFKGPRATSDSLSSRLKRHVLKRFTTENPRSKTRMIAVTRTPLQTRFLLRSRDTALFRAMELGFFDKTEEGNGTWQDTIDLWKSTIDCQKDHEHNDDLAWNDPRRFALSLIMAQINESTNLRSIKEMSEHAMCVLLRGSSANGLFPGCLDGDERHDPSSYRYETRRDGYWEVVFEIPYILWNLCLGPDRNCVSDEEVGEQSGTQTDMGLVLTELRALCCSSNEISTLLRESQGRLTGSRRAKAPLDYSMKYVQPFNNMVEEQNIVELQDEWLYNEPAFFVSGGTILDNVMGEDGATRSAVQVGNPFIGFLNDVPTSKPSQKLKSVDNNTGRREATDELDGVRELMSHGRSKEDAKKRFWAFFSADPSGNEACLNTCFKEENKDKEMRSFFDRHSFCFSLFTEETSAVLNTWTTELHLSFYRLDTSTTAQGWKAQNDRTVEAPIIPRPGKDGQKRILVKTVMSFRFEGDFFDRYWTCRFLEADGEKMHRWGGPSRESCHQIRDLRRARLRSHFKVEMIEFLANEHGDTLGKKSWQQRRVLELMLFGRILQRMHLGASEVLEAAWLSLRGRGRAQNIDHVRRRHSTISVEPEYDVFLIKDDEYVISRKKVEQVQRVLRALMGNLEENIAQIALWQNREKDRLAERPRWTFHDEIRFRVIIQKLLVSNDHDMLKITRIHLKITKLEESLVKKLEIMRSDLEERRGGDTQLFTWVTVIVLPLGFATGVFSMSGAPASQILRNMIYTALGALGAIAMMWTVAKAVMNGGQWKADLKQKLGVETRNVEQREGTSSGHARTTSFRRIWNLEWMRRRASRSDQARKKEVV